VLENKANNHSIAFVNLVMNSINGLTDNIYEALMDKETESVNYNIDELINVLKDLQVSCKDEL
jgi:hypothetical protein